MKNLIIGLLVGGIIGLWFGINIGKDKPLFSNPFVEKSMHERLMESGEELLDKTGDAIKHTGESLRDKFKD